MLQLNQHWLPLCLLIVLLLGTRDSRAQQDTNLDRVLISNTVESVASEVSREYFDPEVAARVALSLRKGLEDGVYQSLKSKKELAETLTRNLYSWTNDKHLAVSVLERPSAESSPGDPDLTREKSALRSNFGIQRVELLPGNLGYLNLTAFYRLEEANDAFSAAMQVLRSADALIIDLRENGGGSPDTVVLLTSYLFDSKDILLMDIVPRSGETRHYRTMDLDPLLRNERRPVYLLTAKQTFSAAECLAYVLQERGRAEIVGEQTAGAANPGRAYPVNDLFEVTIPNGQIRTAITAKNWEGTGVTPDIPVPASDALETAQIRSLQKLLLQESDSQWKTTLQQRLGSLQSDNKP
jgi:retinol-binding protein 3